MTVVFIRTGSAAALPEHAVAQEITSDEVLASSQSVGTSIHTKAPAPN
jgi:hypothetical protein